MSNLTARYEHCYKCDGAGTLTVLDKSCPLCAGHGVVSQTVGEKHEKQFTVADILWAILYLVFGIVGGGILAFVVFSVVGIITWNSNTGSVAATAVWLLIVCASPILGSVCRRSKDVQNTYEGESFGIGWLFIILAVGLLIGGVLLPLCAGWIGWKRTLIPLLLSLGSAGFGVEFVWDFYRPRRYYESNTSQPTGTKRIYDRDGNVKGYVDE